MIERVHEHIITELQQNGRTDATLILTAIALNLLTLAINSIIGTGGRSDTTNIVMGVFVALLVVVNLVAIFGLLKGKETRTKLINEDLGTAVHRSHVEDYRRAPRGRLTTRYHGYITGDNSDEGQYAPSRVEMGNVGLINDVCLSQVAGRLRTDKGVHLHRGH